MQLDDQCGPQEASEIKILTLLAGTLADDEWWNRLAADRDDVIWRDSLSRRAIELYRITARILAGRATRAVPQPLDHATAALRNIADACAMESRTWTPEERAQIHIPRCATIQNQVRDSRLDARAREFGIALKVAEAVELPADWETPAIDPSSEHERDVPAYFDKCITTYDDVLGMHASDHGRRALGTTKIRDLACLEIAVTRGWVAWARDFGPPEALPVTVAMLYMAQMLFVGTRDPTGAETLFPDKPFLRAFLDGSTAWLTSQGSQLPDWLSTST